MRTKLCPDCNKKRLLSSFSDRRTKSGVYKKTYCKKCMVKRATNWRIKNADRSKEYRKIYYQLKKQI